MNIIKATPADLIEIFYLLKRCVKEMNSKGWLYWNLDFELLRKDVEKGSLFLYKTDYHSLGMITFSTEVLPGYEEVKWTDSSKKPLIINRLIVHPNWRKHGIADHLLAFAEEYAKDQGFTSLRLDVYAENQEAISVYSNLHYQQTGQMQMQAQKVPFYCFEKVL
jgi:ribosomal protein S18 acetylase RimI-like enzyme